MGQTGGQWQRALDLPPGASPAVLDRTLATLMRTSRSLEVAEVGPGAF